MSIFSSLDTGVNGVQSQSTRIGIISENLANTSTVGYKSISTLFSSIVTGQSGVAQGNFNPGGVQAGSRLAVATSGLLRGTASPLDLAISGNGFFVVDESATSNANLRYTRAGAFSQNADGNFINQNGFFLKGWRLNDDGTTPAQFDTPEVASGIGLGALETVNVSQLTVSPIPTTIVELQANLQASQPIFTGAYDALDPLANMAAGAVQPHFRRPFEVVDDQGTTKQFNYAFLKTGVNTWEVEVFAQDPTEVNAADGLIASGQVVFNGDGTPATIASTLTDPVTIDWTTAAGDSTITFDYGTAGAIFGTPGTTIIGRQDGIYQLEIPYTVNNLDQNGQAAGALRDIAIDSDGFIVALYNNDTSRRVFKIPLANFLDPSQLAAETGNVFNTTLNSTAPTFLGSLQSSQGSILSARLEDSNVDLSNELVELTIAQRAYQANTSVITASDELLQTLDRMGA